MSDKFQIEGELRLGIKLENAVGGVYVTVTDPKHEGHSFTGIAHSKRSLRSNLLNLLDGVLAEHGI